MTHKQRLLEIEAGLRGSIKNRRVGDEVSMADLRNGGVINVVIREFHLDGKVIVEDTQGPKPRRQWITGAEFLLPRRKS